MKLAIIGGGSIGTRHAKNLAMLTNDVPVIYDLQPETCSAARLGFPVRPFHSYPALFNDGHYSAVLICVPAYNHAEAIVWAIRERVPFFVEKPATLGVPNERSPLGVGMLTSLEWWTDLPNLVGCNLRWRPEANAMRTATFWNRQRRLSLSVSSLMSQWPGRGYTSALWECGAHEFDLALYIAGPVESIGHVDGSPMSCRVKLHHCDGTETTVAIDGTSSVVKREWTLDYDSDESDDLKTTQVIHGTPTDINDCYVEEMRHFLAVVTGREASVNPLSRARAVVSICQDAEERMVSRA